MVAFLLILLVAIGLGLAGVVVSGFTYLLIAGIALFILNVVVSTVLLRRRGRPSR